jgi:hypothetical protein
MPVGYGVRRVDRHRSRRRYLEMTFLGESHQVLRILCILLIIAGVVAPKVCIRVGTGRRVVNRGIFTFFPFPAFHLRSIGTIVTFS